MSDEQLQAVRAEQRRCQCWRRALQHQDNNNGSAYYHGQILSRPPMKARNVATREKLPYLPYLSILLVFKHFPMMIPLRERTSGPTYATTTALFLSLPLELKHILPLVVAHTVYVYMVRHTIALELSTLLRGRTDNMASCTSSKGTKLSTCASMHLRTLRVDMM